MAGKQAPSGRCGSLSRRRFLGSAALFCCTAEAVRGSLTDAQALAGEPDWSRIYLAADEHTDYFWTADAETYRQAFLEMLDYYLDRADATAGEPVEYQSRWNCDGSLWLWTYERNKPAEAFERLIARIKDGHVSAPLNALVVCLGGAPTEAVLRGFYYAGRLERRYDLRFVIAVAVENQTLPYGLSALWAGSGAKYSWKGICGCVSKIPRLRDREHDIYWIEGPDGSRVLMKWNSLAASNQSMGGYAEARYPAEVIDYIGSDDFRARYPYKVVGAFGQGWDDLKTLDDTIVQAARQHTSRSRSVIVSNQIDFFQDFERTYGGSIPSLSCSFGNEWDLYCASLAEVSARVKRAVEALRAAEALATLVSLRQPGFMDAHGEARDEAFMALGLYWEHDWTADGPVAREVRAAWQRELAGQIEAYVGGLHTAAAAALGRMIGSGRSRQRFYAFNPLGWPRTDHADLPYAGAAPVHVVDLATGQQTPAQIVTVDGERRLRILASDVPAVGYKVFEIRRGGGTRFADAATVAPEDGRLENAFYRLRVADRGAIVSLIDKQRGDREFAPAAGEHALNDLVVQPGVPEDPGAGPGASDVATGPGAPRDLAASSGALRVENAGPVSVTLVATAPLPLLHETRITLFRDSRRIDIRNDIEQNFAELHTWEFELDLGQPDVWHEEVGAVIRAKLLADGGHYAGRNARYDWLTLNHFADISGGGVGVTLSNWDCYFFRLGTSTPTVLDTATPRLAALVGGQVDGPELGIGDQGGDAHFRQRFALCSHDAFAAADAMRFALEHQNPLIAHPIERGAIERSGIGYPETTFGLIGISEPRTLLWALKPAEDGIREAGVIARLWNLTAEPAEAILRLATGPIAGAVETTHIETPIGAAPLSEGALQASLAPHQMKTYALKVRAES